MIPGDVYRLRPDIRGTNVAHLADLTSSRTIVVREGTCVVLLVLELSAVMLSGAGTTFVAPKSYLRSNFFLVAPCYGGTRGR